MAVLGALVTLVWVKWLCGRLYPDYYYEGFLSIYGMQTGTLSSGILLLREIDPYYKTPAANNLLLGSGIAIMFGAPMLPLIGMAPVSEMNTYIVLGALFVYLFILLALMLRLSKPKKEK